jgi:hypothetical protein
MTYECEFCKNSYKTNSSLKNHQKTTIKCLEIIESKGIPEEEALEYFYSNVYTSYNQENDVIFCFDDFKEIE